MAAKKKDVSNQRAENQRLNKSNPNQKAAKPKARTTRLNKEESYRRSLIQKYSVPYGHTESTGDAYTSDGAVQESVSYGQGSPLFAGRQYAKYYPRGMDGQGMPRPGESVYKVIKNKNDGESRRRDGSSYGFSRTPIEAAMMNVAFNKGTREQLALGKGDRYSLPSKGPMGAAWWTRNVTGFSGGSPASQAFVTKPAKRVVTGEGGAMRAENRINRARNAYYADQTMREVRQAEAKVRARRTGPETKSYTSAKKKNTKKGK